MPTATRTAVIAPSTVGESTIRKAFAGHSEQSVETSSKNEVSSAPTVSAK